MLTAAHPHNDVVTAEIPYDKITDCDVQESGMVHHDIAVEADLIWALL